MSEALNVNAIRERREQAAREIHCLPVDFPQSLCDLLNEDVIRLCDEVERLTKLIDTPHTDDFMRAVPLEAAHQIRRWGVEHDDGKEPEDWLWLVGYLAGKCLRAASDYARTGDARDLKKAKHHTVSTAAVMLNWFRRMTGDDATFRPGFNPARAAGRRERTERGAVETP